MKFIEKVTLIIYSNIISNSMSISIWMDRHRRSTKFSKRFNIIWNIIKNNIRSKHSIYTIIT